MVSLLLLATDQFLRVGLGLGGEAPDLLVLAILLAARAGSPPVAGLFGLFAGLLKDAVVLTGFGANALAGVIVAAVSSFSREIFVEHKRSFYFVYFVTGKLLFDLLSWVLGAERTPVLEAARAASVGAVYMAGAGLAVVLTFRLLED